MASVTVSSFQIPDWQHGGATAKLRLYCSRDWTDSLGVPHIHGAVGSSKGFFQEIVCTVAGTTLTVPAFTTSSTEDALLAEDRTVLVTGVLFDSHNARRETLFKDWVIPATTPTTWATLRTINSRKTLPLPVSHYLDTVGVQALIDLALGSRNHASSVVEGTTLLDYDPDSPTVPRAIGANSPVVGRNSKDYASLSAAVSAIGNVPTTLVVTDSLNCSGSITVPSTLTLKFVPGGMLSGSGTVTIQGAIIATPQQIFASTLTVRFTNNKSIEAYYPQWWGGGLGLGTDSASLQAMVNAMPNYSSAIFTTGLKLHLTTTVNIFLRDGLIFKGMGLGSYHSYENTALPYLLWEGAANSVILDVNKTAGFEFENLGFQNPTGVCVNIDHSTPGVESTSTGGAFRSCYFLVQGTNSIGLNFSATSAVLVDNMRISHCDFRGGGNGSVGSGLGIGIQVGNSSNVFGYIIDDNCWFEYLNIGVNGGNLTVSHAFTTANNISFTNSLNAAPSLIEYVHSEFDRQFFVNNGGQVTIRGNRFGAPATPSGVAFISTPSTLSDLIFEGNYFDLTPGLKVFDGPVGHLISRGNNYPHGDATLLGFMNFNYFSGSYGDRVTNGGGSLAPFDIESPFIYRKALKGLQQNGVSKHLIGLEARASSGGVPGIDSNSRVSIDDGGAGALFGGSASVTGSLRRARKGVSANYTISGLTDDLIFVDATSGNRTITLPGAGDVLATDGFTPSFTIYKTDASANTVTVVDGAFGTMSTLTAQHKYVTIVYQAPNIPRVVGSN